MIVADVDVVDAFKNKVLIKTNFKGHFFEIKVLILFKIIDFIY